MRIIKSRRISILASIGACFTHSDFIDVHDKVKKGNYNVAFFIFIDKSNS